MSEKELSAVLEEQPPRPDYNHDRVYAAYRGELGPELQAETHRRIDWILAQVGDAAPVLDVGCSQGIVPILLARRGQRVTGIDREEAQVLYARALVEREYPECAPRLDFIFSDFMDFKPEAPYPCVTMTEVLEHLDDPDAFLAHARALLPTGGRLVVTVPFGVNPHPDHRQTFYAGGLHALVSRYFRVTELRLLGAYMGLVAVKDDQQPGEPATPPEALLAEEERAFLQLDSKKTARAQTLYQSATQANEKAARYARDIETTKGWLAAANEKAEKYRQELHRRDEQSRQAQLRLAQQLEKHMLAEEQLVRQLQNSQRELRELREQAGRLKSENARYAAIRARVKGTWYGRLALRCYRLLQKARKALRGKK